MTTRLFFYRDYTGVSTFPDWPTSRQSSVRLEKSPKMSFLNSSKKNKCFNDFISPEFVIDWTVVNDSWMWLAGSGVFSWLTVPRWSLLFTFCSVWTYYAQQQSCCGIDHAFNGTGWLWYILHGIKLWFNKSFSYFIESWNLVFFRKARKMEL